MIHHRKQYIWIATAVFACGFFVLSGCNEFKKKDLEDFQEPNVQAYFNSPGTRHDNQRNLKPVDLLIERIDGAKESIELAVYGFSSRKLTDAIIRAWDRGIDVRVVGDAGHLQAGEYGYKKINERRIPMQSGNHSSIMHNKFIVIDDRYVFVGTGNFTGTGFRKNDNNWLFFDSMPIADDFQAEFEQMFEGRFSNQKNRIQNGHVYEVGDTTVELYFAPQEDVMGRVFEELDNVRESIYFQIFAFTKDRIGSQFIELSNKFKKRNEQLAENGELPDDWRTSIAPRNWPNKVVGLLDRSQIHGNGQYHESYRMQAFGVPMRVDTNENSVTPGDYQAGGGRLHTKTMILDPGTEHARVLTGSFNWSAAASISNDEVFMILRGERITERFMETWDQMWLESRSVSGAFCYYMTPPKPTCSKNVERKDVVFSEVHWDGWNGLRDPTDHTGARNERDAIFNDQFIELYNTTDEPINLSMWTITNGDDFKVGFPPGTVIGPNEYYLVLDHNIESYSENTPQRGNHAFRNANFVLNTANDPRQHTLDLKNASFYLDLRDATGEVIDEAGDGGPPFWGGRTQETVNGQQQVAANYSMERKIDGDDVPDGTEVDSWQACQNSRGNENVNEEFRDRIIATPGAENSEAP